MKYFRQIILGILLFGVISVGSVSGPLLAFGTAATGDIGSIKESLEFDTTDIKDANVIQISGDMFAVVYVDDDDATGDGKIATFTVTAGGIIGDTVTELEATAFAENDIESPTIFHVTGDIYGIIFVDNGKIKINTYKITPAGVITTVTTEGTFDDVETSGDVPDIVHVSGTSNTEQFFVFSYTTSNAINVYPIKINAAGTAVDKTKVAGNPFTTISANGDVAKLIKLETETQYAAVYRPSDNVAQVITFDLVTATGAISAITSDANALDLFNNVAIDPFSHFDIQHIDGIYYAVAYIGPTDQGIVETIKFENNDSTIASVDNEDGAITFATTAADPVFLKSFNNSTAAPLVIAYRAGTADADSSDDTGAGAIRSLTVTALGVVALETPTDTTDINFDDTLGKNPSLVHRSGDFYVIAFEGSDNDGFVKSFNLGDGDNTAPTIVTLTYTSSSANIKAGETITFTLVANENLGTPVCTTVANCDIKFADSNGIPSGTLVTLTDIDGSDKGIAATLVVPAGANAAQTGQNLDFEWTIRDVAGNDVTFDETARTGGQAELNIDTTAPTVTSLDIQENGDATTGSTDFADEDKTIELDLVASETLSAATATIPADLSAPGAISMAEAGGFPRTSPSRDFQLTTGDTEGIVQFTILATDAAGNTATFTNSDITDPGSNGAVVYDDTNPTYLTDSGKFISNTKASFGFDEVILTFTSFGGIDITGGTGDINGVLVTPSANATGVLVTIADTVDITDATLATGTTTATGNTFTVVDRAGNSATVAAGQTVAAFTATPSTSLTDTVIVIDGTSTTTSIDASASTNPDAPPELVLTSATPAAAPLVITPPSTAGTGTITLPRSTSITSGPTTIELKVSTVTPSGISGEVKGIVIQLGNPLTTIVFDKPVSVILAGQSAFAPFIIEAGETAATAIALCTEGPYTAATFAAGIPGGNTELNDATELCYEIEDSDLEIWTRHFSSFGSSGAVASSSSGGGGGGGDSAAPSIFTAFDSDEFPLVYDGVRYTSDNIDSVHTSITEIGESLNLTLQVYDNSGPQYVRHFEVYVNQFSPRILNDLSETIIIYDAGTGSEIIDPNNLISSATITPSTSATNKAVFDVEIIFNGEIPESYVLFRLWDQDRNSMTIELANALIVVAASESNSTSESTSTSTSTTSTSTSTSTTSTSTPEPITVIESGTIVEDGTVIPSGTIIKAGVTIESGVTLETGVIIESGVIIKTGVVTDSGVSLDKGITSDQILITESNIVKIESNTIIESGTIGQGTIIKEGTIIKAGVIIESGVTLEPGVIIESGVTIEKGVTTEKGIAIVAGQTIESKMTTENSIETSAKTYSPREHLTIEKWGGFSSESISDVEVLYEFNIQGTNIPSWFKHTAKWYVNDTLDKSVLVDALENLSKRGILN